MMFFILVKRIYAISFIVYLVIPCSFNDLMKEFSRSTNFD